MNPFPDTALAVVFIVVIGGALLWLGGKLVQSLAVRIGNWIADLFGGSARW